MNIKSAKQALSTFLSKGATKQGEKSDIPHCVNPACPYFSHRNPADDSWRTEHGTYYTKAFGEIQRYRCRECGKTFSTQSFSMDYYVKKPVDYSPLIQALCSSSGQENLARFISDRYELIQNRYERLCRVFLALQAALREKLKISEHFVLDGFETFSRSQYYPNNVNILVGKKSEFIYSMGFSQLRRKGKMTTRQKEKRAELEQEYGRAPGNAVEFSVTCLLNDLCNFLSEMDLEKKELYTDEHKSYVRSFHNNPDFRLWLDHIRCSSKAPRTKSNPLFAANYTDRQFRKDLANHGRESVQFARCPASMMVRLTIYQIYHNFLMPRRSKKQRKGNWQTRAEKLGISRTAFFSELQNCWGKRVFYHKSKLWTEEKKTWLMLWRNSRIKMGRRIPLHIAA